MNKLKECETLTQFYSPFVSLILELVPLSVLYVKWQLEKPRRVQLVWKLDVAKQLVGIVSVHFVNLLLFPALSQRKITCGLWYLLAVFVDCTLGVSLATVTLKFLEFLARQLKVPELTISGFYGFEEGGTEESDALLLSSNDEFNQIMRKKRSPYQAWFLQLIEWVAVAVSIKFIVVLLLLNCADFIRTTVDENQIENKMILISCLVGLNSFKVYVLDCVLKDYVSTARGSSNLTPTQCAIELSEKHSDVEVIEEELRPNVQPYFPLLDASINQKENTCD